MGMFSSNLAHVAPEFTMNRMIRDYLDRFYMKLYHRTLKLRENEYHLPKELAHWKHSILERWKNIQVLEYDLPDIARDEFRVGKVYTGKVTLDLDGLSPDEIGVEMVHAMGVTENGEAKYRGSQVFECTRVDGNIAEYTFEQEVNDTGVFDIGFRIYPRHADLPHRMDFPLVRWI